MDEKVFKFLNNQNGFKFKIFEEARLVGWGGALFDVLEILGMVGPPGYNVNDSEAPLEILC